MQEERLRTLRDGLMKFASGCTRDDADKVLAQVIADFGMRPDQLPDVVDLLASASRFGPHSTLLFLYQLAAVARTVPGRKLLVEIAKNVAYATEPGEPSH